MNHPLILAFAAATWAMEAFDVHFTQKGLKAGVGVETNPVIKFLTRTDKPGMVGEILADQIYILPAVALALLSSNPAAFGFSAGWLAITTVKHIFGAEQWDKALHGIYAKTPSSALEKFLGL